MELTVSIVVNWVDEIQIREKKKWKREKEIQKKTGTQTLGGTGVKESQVSVKELEGNVNDVMSLK